MPAVGGTRTQTACSLCRLLRGPPLLQRPAQVRYRQQALTGRLTFRNWLFRSSSIVLAHHCVHHECSILRLHLYIQSLHADHEVFSYRVFIAQVHHSVTKQETRPRYSA